jgi:hypothetical protein
MGHNIIFYTPDGKVVEALNTKWLRDYAPHKISWNSPYFTQKKLETHEIAQYAAFLRQYTSDLTLKYPDFPIEQLREVVFTDMLLQENFNRLIEVINEKALNHCALSELYDELNDLFDILVEEDSNNPGFADEGMVKFWDFQEALEVGLYMVSPEAMGEDVDAGATTVAAAVAAPGKKYSRISMIL